MTTTPMTETTPRLAAVFDEASVEELRVVMDDPSDDTMVRFCQAIEQRLWHKRADPPAQPQELRYQLLRFIVDEERSRIRMQALADRPPGIDPDEVVLKLWRQVDDRDSGFLTDKHLSRGYHRQRLFAWFVDRYDLSRARQIEVATPWLATTLQFIPLIGAAVALLLIYDPAIALTAVLLGYAVPTLVWWICGSSPLDFIQSLVPRLAGTAAAGAALMLSSSDLLTFLHRQSLPRSLLLLAPAVAYLALEIQHRVHPRLRSRELMNRVANVVFLALAHAAGIVVFIMPAIRYLLVANQTLAPSEDLSLSGLFAITTAVFTAGLVLNVIWAEEPITRPL